MKKLFFAAAAVLAFGVTNAQEVKFGAKAGLNLSTLTGDDDTSMKVGFQVGGFAEIGISDKFAIQPELLYSAQGTKYDGAGDPSLNLDYLNIPVMAKYYVTEGFSLEAGPQIGFLLSAKAKSDGGDVDFKDYVNSTDFGLNVGAGYDVTENINLGLRYGFGLSDVNKEGDDSIKNSNFAFAVAYKF
ncbi:porin family protein [Flavobacterium sp. J27]|uniref:porin family protein n=1 Tax=Flavobacterium sp. J27 TaxID=2060419 RepID=UPI001030BF9E|nr:porin family protein [Flavobacterium sp. J27]